MAAILVLPLFTASWLALLLAAKRASLRRSSRVQVELEWWRLDLFVPSNGTGRMVASARQRYLHHWFDLGTVAALFMAMYACVLLAKEATLLLGRLGLTRAQGDDRLGTSQLQLVLPGVTLPLGHALYIWVALVVSMAVHEAGHALAAAAEGVRLEGAGLCLTLFLPTAYVLLDEADLSCLGRQPALRIACAGAWHNAVLSMACWACSAGLQALSGQDLGLQAPLLLLLRYAASVSAALGLLNMAPVHRLDGEKALNALARWRDLPLPQAHRPQQDHASWRKGVVRWLLHIGTAGLLAVMVLHAACLRLCMA